MMGGAWYEEMFGEVGEKTEDDFITLAIEAVREQLGIKEDPIRVQCLIQKVSSDLFLMTFCVLC